MDFSDDDEELQSVTSYHFVDENEIPISFSALPLNFDVATLPSPLKVKFFLHGSADSGLQKVFKQVIAWKIGLHEDQPEVMVLSKPKKWIKLLKARKSYEEHIRTTVVTIHLLHYLKKNPNASGVCFWDDICRTFSTFETLPSENDLREHLGLLRFFMEHDETLGKSELLQNLLIDAPHKKAMSGVDVRKDTISKPFINDEVEKAINDDGEEPDKGVCSICDNGGSILCCEGRCMRLFHALKPKEDDGSSCETLRFTEAEYEAIHREIQVFLCKNCQYKQHQCFACGKLGSSDKSKGADVYKCVSATCGHFYHPRCVAALLFPGNVADALDFQNRVANDENFMCPVHKCVVCKLGENKEVEDLQFAMCRRCPKSYHRKCLPTEIAFDVNKEGTVTRAWDGLLQNKRILIYCLKHEIDEDLGTPARNHLIFPGNASRINDVSARHGMVQGLAKKRKVLPIGLRDGQASAKPINASEKFSRATGSLPNRKNGLTIMGQAVALQNKNRTSKESIQTIPRRNVVPVVSDDKKMAIIKNKRIESGKANTSVPSVSLPFNGLTTMSSVDCIDTEKENRVLALLDKIKPSTLDAIKEKQIIPSLYSYTSKLDRSITLGKIEGSIEAIRAALQKLESSGVVEDAKAVCEPDVLKQMSKWNNKLKVYLAPFIHGMRYSSYGRHFTKVKKLNEVVDRIHWYVKNGDTIVDFCCGANDFSQLMKLKLEATGKSCAFKNYDLIQPKNDFFFEKRDWMEVQPTELPTGSQLIMGLNPPFGLKAALANKFIDKALTFKPKLLVLIVPNETERLDKKASPYDLIWEDAQELSGKSFYLPGSVDTDDKQIEQWNIKPPTLYLWSRPDWTAKHKAIAAKLDPKYLNAEPVYEEPFKELMEGGIQVGLCSEEVVNSRDGRNMENKCKVLENGNMIVAEGNSKGVQSKSGPLAAQNKRRSSESDGKTISKSKAMDDEDHEENTDSLSVMSISQTSDISKKMDTEVHAPLGPKLNFGTSGCSRNEAAFDDVVDGIEKRINCGGDGGRTQDLSVGGLGRHHDNGMQRSDKRVPSCIEEVDSSNDFDVCERTEEAGTSMYSIGGPDNLHPLAAVPSSLPGSVIGSPTTPKHAPPHADGLNHARPEPPALGMPLPGGGISSPPGTRIDNRPIAMGFVLGAPRGAPPRQYPNRGSSGWVDD